MKNMYKYLIMGMIAGCEVNGFNGYSGYNNYIKDSIPKQSEESQDSAILQAQIKREKKRLKNLELVKKGGLKSIIEVKNV